MRVLILGAGLPDAAGPGLQEPLAWLAETDGEVMVQRQVRACSKLDVQLVFAVNAADIRRCHIDSVIALAAPSATIVHIRGDPQGAACTALLCVRHLDPESELLILNANEFLDTNYLEVVEELRSRDIDGGVVVFPSIHPRYSSALLDDHGFIVQVAEKHPISHNAIAGFYWFRRAATFITAAKAMIRKDAHLDGVFYISLTLNELILGGARLGVTEVGLGAYCPLKSPRQIAHYEAGFKDEAGA
jgi:hypothetical protein